MNTKRIRKRIRPRYFRRPALGVKDFGAQGWALKIEIHVISAPRAGRQRFRRPALGVKDFGAQGWALIIEIHAISAPRAGRQRFRRPALGVESDVWAEFFVRFGFLKSVEFEINSSLLARINYVTECVWARYEL